MNAVFKTLTAKRNPWSHKGDFGYVLVVGGSMRYSGSPVFNAVASLRSGADLVTVVGPRRAMDITATFLPDLITYPLDGEVSQRHVSRILSIAKSFDSLIIGCGMNRSKATQRAIRNIIARAALPMVIDAEAIRALAIQPSVLKGKLAVLTPHAEEFLVLTGEKLKTGSNTAAMLRDREAKVKKWAGMLGVTLLLKGHIDVISDGKNVAVNRTGSPYMTKGGFGDTLSGVCGALLARGMRPFDAARIAAYTNGRAGELACKKYGSGVLASDIFLYLPRVP